MGNTRFNRSALVAAILALAVSGPTFAQTAPAPSCPPGTASCTNQTQVMGDTDNSSSANGSHSNASQSGTSSNSNQSGNSVTGSYDT